MRYYKVPKHLDGKQLYTSNQGYYTLVENELITEKECEKIGIANYAKNTLPMVEVKKNKIYFFFGARFEIPDKL